MAPPTHLLQVDGLAFGYGASRLFSDIAFSVSLGERLALVAPNGAGKSTLLRLIAGEMPPDEGRVVRRNEASLGYYRQSHELDQTLRGDVMSAFLSGFSEVMTLRHDLDIARQQLAHSVGLDADRALARLIELEDAYTLVHGDDVERRIAILAHKLGFDDDDLKRPVTSLSGGERGRLNLGLVLARDSSILLLDEPTNHLDIETISWLEDHLRSSKSAILLVSHDRRFLDRVTNRTAELGTRSFRLYPVAYSAYVIQREEELIRERAVKERQQDFVDKTEDFIRRNIAGQKTKQAQSRRKMLDKLDRVDAPEDIWQSASKLRLRFSDSIRSGDIVLDAKSLTAKRGNRTLFSNVDLLVRRGDRVGIVGPNGAGKSTLLKMLAAKGHPTWDSGTVRHGTNLQLGYFDQHLGELNPTRTSVDEIRQVRGDMNVDVARQYLARFRITGDDALRPISGFSGGERSRLALAKLLLEPRNLLFLDEPTNHLDIPACEILEQALAFGFDGTLVLVSHDRLLLETVTTRLIVVENGQAEVLPGGYADYTNRREPVATDHTEGTRKSEQPSASARNGSPPANATPSGPAVSNHELRRQAARDIERIKRQIAQIERSIAETETLLTGLRETLLHDPKGDWEALARNAERERDASRKVEELLEEWARLGERLNAETLQES